MKKFACVLLLSAMLSVLVPPPAHAGCLRGSNFRRARVSRKAGYVRRRPVRNILVWAFGAR